MDACEKNLPGCACAARKPEPAPLPDEAPRLKWWLNHSRSQTALLWELLKEYLDEDAQSAILQKLGRNCAKSLGWMKNYTGDPEGFFQYMYDHSGEVITYDREKNVITVVTRERDCDCLLVNSCHISPVYCNCSIGWQQYAYETILGKKVDVSVKEAVIRGSSRCVFEITVTDEPAAAEET